MNTKKMTTTIVITATMIAAIFAVAVSADWCDPPCGTKVVQADFDATYALTAAPFALWDFYDDDNSNSVTPGDTIYIDMTPGNPIEVRAGDVRLSWYCNTYKPNTKVKHADNDIGVGLMSANGALPQNVVSFVDVNANGLYDIGDPLYMDIGNIAPAGAVAVPPVVSVGDLRLTEVTAIDIFGVLQTYEPYTFVEPGDADLKTPNPTPLILVGGGINNLGGMLLAAQGTFAQLLGFIDSDCDDAWSCPDKLYLEQPRGAVAPPLALPPDGIVTIGDFRIYIPQEAIDNEGWPECGLKVREGDIDAAYFLTQDRMDNPPGGAVELGTLALYDADGNGFFNYDNSVEGHDGLYIDMTLPGWAAPVAVSAGDVRLVKYCGTHPPNEKVIHGHDDLGMDLVAGLNQVSIVRWLDNPGELDNIGAFDADDYVYLDINLANCVGDGIINANDVRLTEVTVRGVTYPAYSVVDALDSDVGIPYTGIVGGVGTLISQLVFYLDDDCSQGWTCPDKLYLQQPHFDTPAGTNWLTQHDSFITIGDLRLYIPQVAIDEEDWPECGTRVEQCSKDSVWVLRPSDNVNGPLGTVTATMPAGSFANWGFCDMDGNGQFDATQEAVYMDMTISETVSVDDVRLTWYCGTEPPNAKVNHSSNDLNLPLVVPGRTAGAVGTQAVMSYADNNGDGAYDLGDDVYMDVGLLPSDGMVGPNDVRLMEITYLGVTYKKFSVVSSSDTDWGRALTLIPDDALVVNDGMPHFLTGWLDGDCSLDWNCADKLYLNQRFDDYVTIGDLRVYMPPGGAETEPDEPCEIYDTNGTPGIQKDEVLDAIGDYFTPGTGTTKETVLAVIGCYFNP